MSLDAGKVERKEPATQNILPTVFCHKFEYQDMELHSETQQLGLPSYPKPFQWEIST